MLLLLFGNQFCKKVATSFFWGGPSELSEIAQISWMDFSLVFGTNHLIRGETGVLGFPARSSDSTTTSLDHMALSPYEVDTSTCWGADATYFFSFGGGWVGIWTEAFSQVAKKGVAYPRITPFFRRCYAKTVPGMLGNIIFGQKKGSKISWQVDKGSAMMAPDPDKRCMGVAYPHPHQEGNFSEPFATFFCQFFLKHCKTSSKVQLISLQTASDGW